MPPCDSCDVTRDCSRVTVRDLSYRRSRRYGHTVTRNCLVTRGGSVLRTALQGFFDLVGVVGEPWGESARTATSTERKGRLRALLHLNRLLIVVGERAEICHRCYRREGQQGRSDVGHSLDENPARRIRQVRIFRFFRRFLGGHLPFPPKDFRSN